MSSNLIYMTELPSSELGFYYIVMQRDLSGKYMTCWIDGNEDTVYYSREELMQFASKSPYKYKLQSLLSRAFDETGFFIWDVDNNSIRRLSMSFEAASLFSDLKASIQEVKAKNNQFDQSFVKVESDKITLKL